MLTYAGEGAGAGSVKYHRPSSSRPLYICTFVLDKYKSTNTDT
jgi:hypothetical protein